MESLASSVEDEEPPQPESKEKKEPSAQKKDSPKPDPPKVDLPQKESAAQVKEEVNVVKPEETPKLSTDSKALIEEL